MYSSFSKRTDHSALQGTLWGRVDEDGAPYRGAKVPLLRGDEGDQLLERVTDLFYGTFDTSKPDQKHFNHTLGDVLYGYGNGWYNIRSWREQWHTPTDGPPTMYVFVVWDIPYMELKASYNAAATHIIS